MMYLTRLNLDPRNQAVQGLLRNPYLIHQRLWQGIPEEIQRKHETLSNAAPPFLFKIELNRQLRLLVQSVHSIDWLRVFNEDKLHDIRPLPEDTKLIEPGKFIISGRTYRFSLLANVTKKVKDYRSIFASELAAYPTDPTRENAAKYKEGKARLQELRESLSKEQREKVKSKKIGVYTEHEQLEWLTRKGLAGGFQIKSAIVEGVDRISAQKKISQNSNGKINKIISVSFSGTLEITNEVDFQITYTQGLGSAKAFGCGLLMLAPLR